MVPSWLLALHKRSHLRNMSAGRKRCEASSAMQECLLLLPLCYRPMNHKPSVPQ